MSDGWANTKELLKLDASESDPNYRLQAHHAAWTTAERTGELEDCVENVRQGLQIYDRGKHREQAYVFGGHDAGVCALYHLSSALAQKGKLDEASRAANRAVQLAPVREAGEGIRPRVTRRPRRRNGGVGSG